MVYHLKEWKYIIDLAKIEPWVITRELEEYCEDTLLLKHVIKHISIMTTQEGIETLLLREFKNIIADKFDIKSFKVVFDSFLSKIDDNATNVKKYYYEKHEL